MSALEEIRAAFARRGTETYGEGVSQLEHALQCAQCAERDGAAPALIAATLLHDIGHLVHDLPQDIADRGIDAQHESLGSAWLSRHFGPEVTEPVRLHVAAKRYLATTESTYFDLLSPASVQSLQLQGGLMSMEERVRFAAGPFAEDAVKLRRWDDEGKIVGASTPDLAYFERYLSRSLRPE
ncbi:phosphonate degradation HD-domain oxygenase [Dongia deserti]|uniref:phosphonate degradation HD-domain oxygenase n=1 Tax=Dongia deserti TaxID=2268030 RepID=UPI000E657AB2|nr:phosphonate degradation HD-domain oxygenase [Dongia deserti]